MKTTEIHWEITNNCNLHCSYCRSDSGNPRSSELTDDETEEILLKFSKAGIKRICFTGGEPFSRKNFIELLKKTSNLGMRASVITNATLVNEETLNLIKQLGIELNISLDSLNSLINDEQRGNGVSLKILEVIKECLAKKIKIQLYVTVSKKNIKQLKALNLFARERNIRIHFKEISHGGRLLEFNDLLLSAEDRENLKTLGRETCISDESCWADKKRLFMSAAGDLYLCNEIFVRQPELKLGNIKYISLDNLITPKKVSKFTCCYGAVVGGEASILYNTPEECGLLKKLNSPITTVIGLYKELNNLYADIKNYCFQCTEQDCMGYLWLLKSEASKLYKAGVPLVKINNGPIFIHSFPENDVGELDVSVRYPVCSQIDCSGRICLIHKRRPLVCRLYPVGLETLEDNSIAWVIHTDCLFIKDLDKNGLLIEFEKKCLSIINRVSRDLADEILKTYREVDSISAFPNGSNNFKILKGGVCNVEV